MAAPQLAISTARPASGSVEDLPVLVSIQTPIGTSRTPSDICCVLDISWSMSMEAKVMSASGSSESNGLSMLDVAKHALRTVINSLGDHDRLAIVSFCREATVVFPLTQTTKEGKKAAEEKLDTIGFGNGTNLWNGIERALHEIVEKGGDSPTARFAHVMLLTDGETEGKDEVMQKLKQFQMTHERLPCTISTFGFGYEIDSPLLVDIADFSDGTYAFIPDAGFVGTVFVNSVSNLLVTMARDATVSLEAGDGAQIVSVLGFGDGARASAGDDVWRAKLGTLQFGQGRDIVVKMKVNAGSEAFLFASLEYTTLGGAKASATAEIERPGRVDPNAEQQRCRGSFVEALRKVADIMKATQSKEISIEEGLEQAKATIQFVANDVKASPARGDSKVSALLEDIEGQTTEALSRTEYWMKWGRHYVPSVMFAHKLQQCNNFKDPGVQVYGSQLFTDTQDDADSAFNGLPAPKITPCQYIYLGGGKIIQNPNFTAPGAAPRRNSLSSVMSYVSGSGGSSAAAPAPRVNMAAFNDRNAG